MTCCKSRVFSKIQMQLVTRKEQKNAISNNHQWSKVFQIQKTKKRPPKYKQIGFQNTTGNTRARPSGQFVSFRWHKARALTLAVSTASIKTPKKCSLSRTKVALEEEPRQTTREKTSKNSRHNARSKTDFIQTFKIFLFMTSRFF